MKKMIIKQYSVIPGTIRARIAIRKAAFLAQTLELPSRSVIPVSFLPSEEIKQQYANDPDCFLNETLGELESLYPELGTLWKAEVQWHLERKSRLIPVEDRNALEVLIEQLEPTSFSSPLALLEICVLCAYTMQLGVMIANIMPWFIRYGSVDLITQTIVIDNLKHNFYREYIARLPPEDLHEFLLSDANEERVMAKNKFHLELLEG